MIIELNVVSDIYSQPDKNGNTKLLKKDQIFKKTFDSAVTTCEEFFNSKGNLVKSYSIITNNNNSYKVKHSYEQVKCILGHIEVKGLVKYTRYAKK